MNTLPTYIRATYFFMLLISVGFVVIYAQSILTPIIFAVLFAFLLLRPTRWLERHHFPTWVAALLSVVSMILIVLVIAGFMFNQVLSFADNWELMSEKIMDKTGQIQEMIATHTPWDAREQNAWLQQRSQAMNGSGGQYLMTLFSFTGALLAKITIIPILIFFMLVYRERFKTFISAAGKHYQWYVLEIMHKLVDTTQHYLRGLMIDILILAILNSAGLLLLGIPYAILLGTLAAILNIVPYIGVLVGSLLPVFMALVTKDNIWIAVGAFGVCSFVQFLDNNFITPKVVGSSVSLNPLAALIALLIGSLIWGVTGMVLAIPLTGMIKVVLDNVPSLHPYGFLLGEDRKYSYDKISDIPVLRTILRQRSSKKNTEE